MLGTQTWYTVFVQKMPRPILLIVHFSTSHTHSSLFLKQTLILSSNKTTFKNDYFFWEYRWLQIITRKIQKLLQKFSYFYFVSSPLFQFQRYFWSFCLFLQLDNDHHRGLQLFVILATLWLSHLTILKNITNKFCMSSRGVSPPFFTNIHLAIPLFIAFHSFAEQDFVPYNIIS